MNARRRCPANPQDLGRLGAGCDGRARFGLVAMKSPFGVRELLSAAAVVASLVFVAWEIRQNTSAQRSAIRQALSDQATDFTMRLAEDPELVRAWRGVWFGEGDPTSLTSLDTARAQMTAITVLRRVENVYHQYREGVLTEPWTLTAFAPPFLGGRRSRSTG